MLVHPDQALPVPVPAFGAFDATSPLRATTIERRVPGDRDVAMQILFCGVCHSDIHIARSEWFPPSYPVIPGHEIIGRVTAVGGGVTKFKVGQLAGVGCLVDSCRTCASCQEGLECYCPGMVLTYGSPDAVMGGMTAGGYSTAVVVDEDFVLSIPENLDPAKAAPLLCAGITTYSPLRYWNVGPGSRVGVVGLGGLGHMAIQLAAAMGAEVTLFTTSPGKAEGARKLGASRIVVSTDDEAMAAVAGTLDFIVNTVAASHNLDPFVAALKRDGVMCLVGIPPAPHPSPSVMGLVFQRKSITGSLIGGIKETQEMLDFCGAHGITAVIELIRMDQINDAWARMIKGDVQYRFVIDIASLH